MSDVSIFQTSQSVILTRGAKSVTERFVALAALVFLAPLFAIIAIAIKLDSPGPVLYLQSRSGLNGSTFRIMKFRSMKVGIETAQATRNDPRITRLGEFLRKSSLDELPQLINVLLGQMAIVGPRPHAIEHDAYFARRIPNYMDRYSVKPGMTGWAQVNKARGETETVDKMARRASLDLEYVRNWSLRMDLRIVFLTPMALFSSDQAY